MEAAKLHPAELAKRAGVHRRTVSDILRGKRPRISHYTLMGLARALDRDVDELLGRQPKIVTLPQAEAPRREAGARRLPRLLFGSVALLLLLVVASLALLRFGVFTLHYDSEGKRASVAGPIFGLPRWESDAGERVIEVALGPWREWAGRRIVLVGGPVDESRFDLQAVRILTGKTLWTRNITQEEMTRVFGEGADDEGRAVAKSFCFADLTGKGEPELVAGFTHSIYSPAMIRRFDRDGSLGGGYGLPGHYDRLLVADLEGDGQDEIIVAGTNNPHHGAMVVVLDADHFGGGAVDATARGSFAGELADASRSRFILPGLDGELMEQLRIQRFHAFRAQVFRTVDDETRVQCRIGSPWGFEGAYILTLDAELQALSLIATDGLKNLASAKRSQGLLDRDVTSPEFCEDWLASAHRFVGGRPVPPVGD
ncbi:MAG: helix-turn-helix transcriptional regulator [Candidatus Krumholzibacteriota bacterium]|nr:helix-turn-helix transcriptional regulator [Candidatus Krumholzibacteriota bacterium]